MGVTALNNHLFIDVVLYRYRAGIPWRDLPQRFGDFPVVHLRRTREDQRDYGRHLYKACHLIENFFSRFKHYRCIAIGCDETARNFLGTIYLAASVVWLN